jgi:hypothetical protein
VADRETAAGTSPAAEPATGSTAAEPATGSTAEDPATGSTTGEEPAADAPARTVDADFAGEELNGGTIPAPAQQQPQN